MYNSIHLLLTTSINNQPTFYLKLEHIVRCLQDRWQALLVARVCVSSISCFRYWILSIVVLLLSFCRRR